MKFLSATFLLCLVIATIRADMRRLDLSQRPSNKVNLYEVYDCSQHDEITCENNERKPCYWRLSECLYDSAGVQYRRVDLSQRLNRIASLKRALLVELSQLQETK